MNLPIKLILGSALFFLVGFLLPKPLEKKRSDYVSFPLAIKNMMVGFNFSFADTLWLRALQDFDYCEKKINESECNANSWLFQTVNLATEVDPVWDPKMYKSAGLALSVLISDKSGATEIFKKAVNQYPTDWELSYVAAYHALYEEKDKKKAAQLYEQAGRSGAPSWVLSLAGRLAADEGQLEVTKRILEGMIATNQDEKIIKRLEDKIAQIESQQK